MSMNRMMSEITCHHDSQLSLIPQNILDDQLSHYDQVEQQLCLSSNTDGTQITQIQMLASNWNDWLTADRYSALENEDGDKQLEVELRETTIQIEDTAATFSSDVQASNILNYQASNIANNNQELVSEVGCMMNHDHTVKKKTKPKRKLISKAKSRFRAFKKGQFDPSLYQRRTSPFGYQYILYDSD